MLDKDFIEEVEQEIQVEDTHEETENGSLQANEEKEKEVEESSAQKSWRELRTQAEEGKKAKKERDEAYRLLQLMEQNIQKQQPTYQQQPQEEDFDINSLADDEYTDNKQLKRILKQQEKHYKKMQEEIDKSRKSVYNTTVESRIRSEYPDFKEVVSDENVALLKERKPHIFKSLSYNPDLYEQAIGAYDAIKDFGIYKPNTYQEDEYRLAKNLSKPKPSASIGTQKRQSALDDVAKYNNPSSEDLKAFYEDAIRKSGRMKSYNS